MIQLYVEIIMFVFEHDCDNNLLIIASDIALFISFVKNPSDIESFISFVRSKFNFVNISLTDFTTKTFCC